MEITPGPWTAARGGQTLAGGGGRYGGHRLASVRHRDGNTSLAKRAAKQSWHSKEPTLGPGLDGNRLLQQEGLFGTTPPGCSTAAHLRAGLSGTGAGPGGAVEDRGLHCTGIIFVVKDFMPQALRRQAALRSFARGLEWVLKQFAVMGEIREKTV